jgi:hypothetical protein
MAVCQIKTETLMRHSILVFLVGIVLASCTRTEGVLIVNLTPKSEEVESIKADGRDMVPQQKGVYRSTFHVPFMQNASGKSHREVKLEIQSKLGTKIYRTVTVYRDEIQQESFDVSVSPAMVEFKRLKTSNELLFQPINKERGKKSIYISFIDYLGKGILLKDGLETKLASFGYVIATDPEKTDIFATIHLIDYQEAKEQKGFDECIDKNYVFKIQIEQRLTGKTAIADKTDLNETTNLTKQAASGTQKGEVPVSAETKATAPVEEPKEDPATPLAAAGGEEPAETKTVETVAATITPQAEPPKPTAESGPKEGSLQSVNENTLSSIIRTKTVEGKRDLNYFRFESKAVIEASIGEINMRFYQKEAEARTIDFLSDKLANIFNI